MLEQRGERLLLCGFTGLAVTFALFQYVLLGLLAFISGPASLICLTIGFLRARDPEPSDRKKVIAGGALSALGIAALLLVGLQTSMLSYRWTVSQVRDLLLAPSLDEWIVITALWVIPALALGTSFRLWTNWSLSRCTGWGLFVIGLLPLTLVLFWALSGNQVTA